MAGLCFAGEAPVRVCGSHGVWLGASDRVLLPEAVQRKLRRREFLDGLLGLLEFDGGSIGGGSSEYCDVSSPDCGDDGGGASCGGCGGGGD